MRPKAQKATDRPGKAPVMTARPVTLRVKTAHIDALDKIASNMGIIRSAAIQIAIAEFIERREK